MRLAIPKSRLMKILNSYHIRLCHLIPDFFGLPQDSVKPIRISCNEKENCPEGLFENENREIPIIYFNPSKSPDFQEARFTLAHETGHYLHYLKRPEFYDDFLNHPKLHSNGSNPDKSKFLYLITQFRELVANMASFESFRLENLLESFLDAKKKEVLANWERINRTGDYRIGSFATLVHYYIYKEFYNSLRCLRVTTATHLDLELFKEVDLRYGKSREYLGYASNRIKMLDALQGPPEPTLFD